MQHTTINTGYCCHTHWGEVLMKDNVLQGLAKLINQAIQTDVRALDYQRLNLNHVVVELNVEDFGVCGYLKFTSDGVALYSTYDLEPNVLLRGRLMGLLGLSPLGQFSPDKAWPKSVQISGDVRKAEQVRHWLSLLNIDWAAFLSNYVGPSIATSMVQVASRVAKAGCSGWQRSQSVVANYIRDEVTPCVTKQELQRFLDEVDALKHQVARFQARITLLENKV